MTSLPIERLILAAPPALRHNVMDALKVNIGLKSSLSNLILPRIVRVAFRRFAGYELPTSLISQDAADFPASDLLVEGSRLSPCNSWREVGQGAFGQVFEALLDGLPVCVKVISKQAVDEEKRDEQEQDDRGTGFFREVDLMY